MVESTTPALPQIGTVNERVVRFRKPSMSVISCSVVLDSDAGSRPSSSLENDTLHKTTIHSAIRAHNQGVLQELLLNFTSPGVEALESGKLGKRPLHVAAEVNNRKATEILMERRANPLAQQACFHGMTPVHIAAARGSFDVLSFYVMDLKSCGSHRFVSLLDARNFTPLHWAVQRNQLDCVRLLLDCGASMRKPQGVGMSVLHMASGQGSIEVLKLMADEYPEQFRRCLEDDYSSDSDGRTPLHRAALLDQPELIAFLDDKGFAVDAMDKEGRTPLDLSVSRGAWRSADALINLGANPFLTDPVHEQTTVHHAALAGKNLTCCKSFVHLLKTNPPLVGLLNALDSKGNAALHYAVCSDDHIVAKGLLQLGADPLTRNRKEKTVLHCAAKKYGSLDMMCLLLKHSPHPLETLRCVDRYGQTVLHVAAQNGHHEIVEYLISNGASAIPDSFGQTPLHLAATKNCYHVLRILMDNDSSNLNSVNMEGQTALHLAALNDSPRSVAFLLSRGASSKVDKSGRTPLELAMFHKNEGSGFAFVNSVNWKELVNLQSSDYGTVVEGLVKQLPEVMKACLDRCMKKQVDEKTKEAYVQYDFSLLQSLSNEEQKSSSEQSRKSPMAVLKAMSRNKRNDLLSHPVCKTLLERKWIIYGLYCSLSILLSNIMFVGILSILLVRSVEEELRPHLYNLSYCNVRKHQPSSMNDTDIVKLHAKTLPNHPGFEGTVLVVALLIFLLVVLLKEAVDFYSETVHGSNVTVQTKQGRRYFYDWTNYIQLLLFVSCAAFVICLSYDNNHNLVTYPTFQFGAIAAFLAWFNLMRFCRPFGTFGIYSFMFFTIFKTLIQVAFFFFILTAAFTITFFTLFQTLVYPDDPDFYDGTKLDIDDLQTAHSYLPTSGMRIASIMLGDLEAVERFVLPLLAGELPFPLTSFVFYGLCLIIMPVLLSNLLMGLSIGDLAAVRKNAVVLRLEMQVSLHESLEKLFPLKWLKRIYEKTDAYCLYPERPLDMATWVARRIAGEDTPTLVGESLNQYEEDAHPTTAEKSELVQIRYKLQELDGNMADVRQLLIQTLHSIDFRTSSFGTADPTEITIV